MVQRRSVETRENILSVASKLFGKYGYEATGVAEICQQARISKGAFYHHFPSKQAIFLTLLENWLSRLENGFHIIQQQSNDVPHAILQMAESVTQAINEAEAQLSLFMEFWTQANRDPEIWRITVAPYHRFNEYFAVLIKRGIDEKSIKQINPQLGAKIIVSLALGLLLQRIFDPNSIDWETDISNSVSILFEGMSRREN
jgi:AcrR family transcriptional regulator